MQDNLRRIFYLSNKSSSPLDSCISPAAREIPELLQKELFPELAKRAN